MLALRSVENITGKNFIDEYLRQTCIYENKEEDWWRYIESFKDNCYNKFFKNEKSNQTLEECSSECMQKIKLNHSIILACVSESFTKDEFLKNKYLEKSINLTKVLKNEGTNSNSFYLNNSKFLVIKILK